MITISLGRHSGLDIRERLNGLGRLSFNPVKICLRFFFEGGSEPSHQPAAGGVRHNGYVWLAYHLTGAGESRIKQMPGSLITIYAPH